MINLLFPKRYKYIKVHNRKRCLGDKFNSVELFYGSYGVISKDFGYISSSQFESIKCIVNKNIRKISKVLFPIFPNLPILKKSKSSRMGSGIGCLNEWVYRVYPGSVIVEMYYIKYKLISDIFNSLSCRLPFRVCLVEKIFCKDEEN